MTPELVMVLPLPTPMVPVIAMFPSLVTVPPILRLAAALTVSAVAEEISQSLIVVCAVIITDVPVKHDDVASASFIAENKNKKYDKGDFEADVLITSVDIDDRGKINRAPTTISAMYVILFKGSP